MIYIFISQHELHISKIWYHSYCQSFLFQYDENKPLFKVEKVNEAEARTAICKLDSISILKNLKKPWKICKMIEVFPHFPERKLNICYNQRSTLANQNNL